MTNRLFFICPTDYLEPMINWYFGGRNYFYSTLGNRVKLDDKTLFELAELIYNNCITNVTFVLSQSNQLFDSSSQIKNKTHFNHLNKQNTWFTDQNWDYLSNWQVQDEITNKVAYFLHQKTSLFKTELSKLLTEPPTINNIIFSKSNNTFFTSIVDLVTIKLQHLN